MSERVISGLRLVRGHRVGDRLIAFPHRCPGPDCAIARWIGDRALRDDVEAVSLPLANDERIVQEQTSS